MRALFLTAVAYVFLANSGIAAPFLSGEIIEPLGRKTSWAVFDEFAGDNPFPTNGEFTYVYNVENVGVAPLQLWQFRLNVEPSDLSFTGISGSGLPPSQVSPRLWKWSVGGSPPLTLSPSQRSVDLVVTSSLAPGPVDAFIYGCDPFLCFIGSSPVIGPAVPEPTTWLLACLLSNALLLRRRSRPVMP